MSEHLFEYMQDVLKSQGKLSTKRLFSGKAVYLNGIIFAIIFNEIIYLKVDETLSKELVSQSLKPFTYQRKDKTIALSYVEAPGDIYDDEEAALYWFKRTYQTTLSK